MSRRSRRNWGWSMTDQQRAEGEEMTGQPLSIEPLIDPTATVTGSRVGAYTEVGARTKLLEVELGDYSYVVHDAEIAYAQIGKFCSIAAMTRINPGNHPMWRASQAHFSYRASRYFAGERDEASFFDWRRSHAVTLGDDVWVGHGAIILPGRRIGTGAVIAAGAIVTKDVQPYAIVAGNPARHLRWRFEPELHEPLMALGWWNWSHDRLRAALPDFRNLAIHDFIAKYSKVSSNTCVPA
jgi:phosphonate metabolism protein (transferase hexapeptide repeat family)